MSGAWCPLTRARFAFVAMYYKCTRTIQPLPKQKYAPKHTPSRIMAEISYWVSAPCILSFDGIRECLHLCVAGHAYTAKMHRHKTKMRQKESSHSKKLVTPSRGKLWAKLSCVSAKSKDSFVRMDVCQHARVRVSVFESMCVCAWCVRVRLFLLYLTWTHPCEYARRAGGATRIVADVVVLSRCHYANLLWMV